KGLPFAPSAWRRVPRPGLRHRRAVRIWLDLPVRQNEDDLGESGGGVAYSRQPAVLQPHVVVDVDRPDIEAKPDVVGSFLARYAIPPVGSLLQAPGNDPRW